MFCLDLLKPNFHYFSQMRGLVSRPMYQSNFGGEKRTTDMSYDCYKTELHQRKFLSYDQVSF